MAIYSIPLAEGNQTFTITLGESRFRLTFIYRKAFLGGWFMDIENLNGSEALYSVPILCECDLLEQYPHKGFGHFWAVLGSRQREYPTFEDMGKALKLYWSDEAFS